MLREILWHERMQPLSNALDALADRHRSIASNISNIEVDGYQKREVVFEEHLKQALAGKLPRLSATNEQHFPQKKDIAEIRHTFQSAEDNSDEYKASGVNSVNLDLEMAKLATNRIHYDAIAKVAQRRFKGMSGIIKGKMEVGG